VLPSDISNKRILISPLNWGMGHVARCIALIDVLLKNNNTLFVAGDKAQLAVFRQYFHQIHFIEFSGYPFRFQSKGWFRFDLIRCFPSLIKRWQLEVKQVAVICEKHTIELIISDHRYGFRSSIIHSVFLTHQVYLPLRWYEAVFQYLHHRYMQKFDEVWIVDDASNKYAGALSRRCTHLHASYIGTLSRFSRYSPAIKNGGIVIVVSGPLPHARDFALIQATHFDGQNVTMILPYELRNIVLPKSIKVVLSDDWLYCDTLICRASKLISRSGYSTIMDIVELKIPFLLFPTPGQSEQEYLFKQLSHSKNSFVSI
jgi:UDP:flavonoid glycosyltransferase YjiC (YdhE family)